MKPTSAHMENEMYITNGPIIESHQKTQMGPGIPMRNTLLNAKGGPGIHLSNSANNLEWSQYCSPEILSSG